MCVVDVHIHESRSVRRPCRGDGNSGCCAIRPSSASQRFWPGLYGRLFSGVLAQRRRIWTAAYVDDATRRTLDLYACVRGGHSLSAAVAVALDCGLSSSIAPGVLLLTSPNTTTTPNQLQRRRTRVSAPHVHSDYFGALVHKFLVVLLAASQFKRICDCRLALLHTRDYVGAAEPVRFGQVGR